MDSETTRGEDPQDPDVHALFDSLRAKAFSVTQSFRGRLSERLDAAEQQWAEAPESFSALVISSLVQFSNLVLGALRPPERTEVTSEDLGALPPLDDGPEER